MKKKDVLFINVENVFTTGILQAMVFAPAMRLHRNHNLSIGLTSMYRADERNQDCLKAENSIEVIEARRAKTPISLINVFLHAMFAARVIVASRRYRIVHCRSYIATLIGLLCKAGSNCTVIFDVRGYLIDEAIEMGKVSPKSICVVVLRKIESTLFARSDYVIAVSKAMARDIKKRFNRDAIIIPNPASIPTKAKAKASEIRPVIVYNGSLTDWHHPDLMFSVFREICSIDSQIDLKIITQHVAHAERLARKFGIAARRLVIEQAMAHEVTDRLVNARLGWCVIRPSFSKSVCCPVKFNEYLAAGVPVVVNEGIGDLAEIVKQHGVGIIVRETEPAEIIASEMVEAIRSGRLHAITRELRSELSWDAHEQALANLYGIPSVS